MTAWVKRGTREEVGLITDFVNLKYDVLAYLVTFPSPLLPISRLTNYIKTLIDDYLSIPYTETKCGYACSDHSSWGKYGYPNACGSESSFENIDENLHTASEYASKIFDDR